MQLNKKGTEMLKPPLIESELQLLLGSCGLWIIYHGLEYLKRHDKTQLGRYVYGMLIVPCLLTSLFIIGAALNMLVDSLIAKAGAK